MVHAMRFFFFLFVVSIGLQSTGQRQTLDVLSYAVPKGWQQQVVTGGVQLAISDPAKGYAVAVITKTVAANGTARENFGSRWSSSIQKTVSVIGAPVVASPVRENGWDIVSGTANFTENNSKGVATLLNATGYGQTLSVMILTNTSAYQDAITGFINSLQLATPKNDPVPPAGTGTVSSSLVGLWVDYKLENNGYVNGFPQLTAGYFRREYQFKSDGTYVFRAKDFSVYMKDILFVYESGTWKVEGNQLTLTPKAGKGEWWGKSASGSTKEWGSRKTTSDYKQEPVTYSFELYYYSGSKDTALLLNAPKDNSRDRGSRDAGKSFPWSYTLRTTNPSLIDNPPGFTVPR